MRIGYELADGIARVRLDDGKANAMSVPWFEELGAALDRAEADGAKALVIAGRAGFFSGGLDLKLLPSLPPEGLRALSETFARTMLRVHGFPIPTVAAVTGHAIAGGAVLAFACDLRFAATGPFKVQLNEVAIGIPMPAWMAFVAESAITSRWQTEALLHARTFAPDEAATHGIVSGVAASADEAERLALDAARRLALLPRAAYAESKRRLRAEGAARALAKLEEEAGGSGRAAPPAAASSGR